MQGGRVTSSKTPPVTMANRHNGENFIRCHIAEFLVERAVTSAIFLGGRRTMSLHSLAKAEIRVDQDMIIERIQEIKYPLPPLTKQKKRNGCKKKFALLALKGASDLVSPLRSELPRQGI